MAYQENKEVPEKLKQIWEYSSTVEDRDTDTKNTPLLLDKLRELGVVQLSNKWQCVFFYPTHNPRTLLMFYVDELKLPPFERLQPYHVLETVNYLMWERLLEPELALSYRGLFDYFHMAEKNCFYLTSCPSDYASDHMCEWLMP